MKTKICIRCKSKKLITKFHKRKKSKDELQSICKHCVRIIRGYKKKYHKNKYINKDNETIYLIINSNKYGIKKILIDIEDYNKIKKYHWCITFKSNSNYFYVVTPSRKSLHRLIMNCPNRLEIDHINHNTLDNRKNNLRICSRTENNYNRKPRNNTSSKYKGVYYDKRVRKFLARVFVNNKQKYLGIFNSENKAAIAYNEAALKYYGQFALLNNLK